jgi:hypothetical protein
MTPGAWTKQGLTYQLADAPPPPAPPPPGRDAARHDRLGRLRAALWVYARSHDGRFPPGDDAPEIEPETWQLPGVPALRYIYVPGRALGQAGAVVAYEPGLYGPSRLVLFADGAIRLVDLAEIRKTLEPAETAEVAR